ncbi:hypothetical protein X726_01265 [Mesorhizobium sp. L103C105A0]|nr:hypothetical protein X726_01265 [Mesorhizobium sp. L103C105A0]
MPAPLARPANVASLTFSEKVKVTFELLSVSLSAPSTMLTMTLGLSVSMVTVGDVRVVVGVAERAVDDVDDDARVERVDGDRIGARRAGVAGKVGVAAGRYRNGAKTIKTVCRRELRRIMRSINLHKISQRAIHCRNIGRIEARHRTKKSERHDRVVVTII